MVREFPIYRCECCGETFRVKQQAEECEERCMRFKGADMSGMAFGSLQRSWVLGKKQEDGGYPYSEIRTDKDHAEIYTCTSAAPVPADAPELSSEEFTEIAETVKTMFNALADRALETVKEWIEDAKKRQADREISGHDRPHTEREK